jgi:hypothetical protein
MPLPARAIPAPTTSPMRGRAPTARMTAMGAGAAAALGTGPPSLQDLDAMTPDQTGNKKKTAQAKGGQMKKSTLPRNSH